MIGKVLVEENQPVKAGDLLAATDDRDFIVAVDAAKAQVAAAQASVEGLAARVAQQETAIRQAQATVAVDDAELKLAEANQKRYRNLASDGSRLNQAQQQARSDDRRGRREGVRTCKPRWTPNHYQKHHRHNERT